MTTSDRMNQHAPSSTGLNNGLLEPTPYAFERPPESWPGMPLLGRAPPAAQPEAAQAFEESFAQFRTQCAERFEAIVRAMAEHLFGAGDTLAADSLKATGAASIDGRTLVLRLNAESDMIEMFCDLGLPDPHQRENCLATVLHANLCRSQDGVTWGLHPESGRLVATLAVHVFHVDAEMCLMLMQQLAMAVAEIRADGKLSLVD